MDIFYNKTITIFNQAFDSDDLLAKTTWYATVLHNVRLLETKGANIATSGIADADSARLHIKNPCEKPYLPPKQWAELIDKASAFTLCGERDFFVVGDLSDEDLSRPKLYEYIKEKYDGVYMITNVDKYDLIPHFEVGGR